MSRGIPWDSLKYELRAYAGLLSLFQRGLDQLSVSRCLLLGCFQFFKKDGRVLERSRSPAGSECARGHVFQQRELADTATEDDFFETEFEEVPDFPDFFAEMLSADAWRLVDHGRLLFEARSAH